MIMAKPISPTANPKSHPNSGIKHPPPPKNYSIRKNPSLIIKTKLQKRKPTPGTRKTTALGTILTSLKIAQLIPVKPPTPWSRVLPFKRPLLDSVIQNAALWKLCPTEG